MLQCMTDPEDVQEYAPQCTRVECKLLLRRIQDITAVTEVSLQVPLQNLSTDHDGLLRQLNMWFPGKFRAALGTPLYVHDDTTVVRATHKVRDECLT